MKQDCAQGFSLISAILLLVILSVLGAYMAQFSVTSSTTSSLALNASRALYAARSGAQWGAYRASLGNCAPTANFDLTEVALSGFAVTVSCAQTQHAEGAAALGYYVVTAVAQFGTFGGVDFVSRTIQVQVIGPP